MYLPIFTNQCRTHFEITVRRIGIVTHTHRPRFELADQFLRSLDLSALEGSYRGMIDDMDRIADRIFERAS